MTTRVQTGVSTEAVERPSNPLRRRWSIGHFAVVIAGALAMVANIAFLRSLDDSVSVVVAAKPLTAGATIERGDLTTVRLSADRDVLASLHTDPESLEGRVARRSLTEGELIGAGDLLSSLAPGGLSSMALPVDPAHAAGGVIRAGDRVDIVDVRDGVASYVVRDAPVIEAPAAEGGALASAGSHLVIGVDRGQVLAVAEAIADGQVDVVVTTGAADA